MKKFNISINSRAPIWVHLTIFVAINLVALSVLLNSFNAYRNAQESVILIEANNKENELLLQAGNEELSRARVEWEGALVIVDRVKLYRGVSEELLSNNAAPFKSLVDGLINQHRLLVVSYEPLPASTIRFGNFNYDGRMFNMTLRGSFRDLGTFIAALENRAPLLEVTNFRLANDTSNPGQLIMNVQAFLINDVNEARGAATR